MEEKFYTCRYDRPFKEIMLNENNKDILTWFLETTLKVKIKNIEVQTVERNTGNINVKRKILDALLITNVGKIQIELNSNNADYVHAKNMLKENISIELISKTTGLRIEEIEKIVI